MGGGGANPSITDLFYETTHESTQSIGRFTSIALQTRFITIKESAPFTLLKATHPHLTHTQSSPLCEAIRCEKNVVGIPGGSCA